MGWISAGCLYRPDVGADVAIRHVDRQSHPIDKILDRGFIEKSKAALESGEKVVIEGTIRNVDRTTGAMLSGEIAKKFGHEGLPDDTISIRLRGTAGQSFGAFLAAGVTLDLTGEANDYVGKGTFRRQDHHQAVAEGQGCAGKNPSLSATPVLYGATQGECYFRGIAGERFAVRNSGAIAVVEGTV